MSAVPGTIAGARESIITRAWRSFLVTLRLIARNKVGLAGFIIVLAVIVISYISPVLWPFNPTPHPTDAYLPPSSAHLLGTDTAGRDILLQVLNGGKDLINIGIEAGLLTTLIALVLGSLSAYSGGYLDTVLTWIADIFLTIPFLPLLAVLAGLLHLSELGMAVVIGVLGWPTLMRAIRAQVLSIKERDFVEAARALDLGLFHILLREIAPTMAGYIAIHFVLAVTSAMYASVGLTLLGLVPLTGNNWGVMLNLAWTRGAIYYSGSLSYILSPIAAITLFQLGLVAMTRSLSEIFDPRLRRGV